MYERYLDETGKYYEINGVTANELREVEFITLAYVNMFREKVGLLLLPEMPKGDRDLSQNGSLYNSLGGSKTVSTVTNHYISFLSVELANKAHASWWLNENGRVMNETYLVELTTVMKDFLRCFNLGYYAHLTGEI